MGVSSTATFEFHAALWSKGAVNDLGTLHGTEGYSEAFDLNAAGQIVGQSCPPFSRAAGCRGFIWTKGVMVDLGTLGGDLSIAYAINPAGQVVGLARTATGDDHGFLWQNGVMTDLGASFIPLGINARGQVVGYGFIQPVGGGSAHALVWNRGVIQDLGPGTAYDINSAGRVVGQSWTTRGPHAALWKKGMLTDLGTIPPYPESQALAINPTGQVVGSVETDDDRRPFLWEKGIMTLLSAPPGEGTARDINASGQVVGDVDGIALLWTRK